VIVEGVHPIFFIFYFLFNHNVVAQEESNLEVGQSHADP